MHTYMIRVDDEDRIPFHAKDDKQAAKIVSNWAYYHKLQAHEYTVTSMDVDPNIELNADRCMSLFDK